MITPGKALFLLIEALVKLPNLNFHLTVLGDGELLESSKKIATPIADKISWKGWLDKEKALELVKSADLLIHTSLKEGTPHSILEAIGLGVPVMCHDTCGMGIVVNDKNGFKIPYRNKETTVDYIVSKLQNINNQPEILNSRFQSIFETTDSLTWERKVAHIANRINDILNSYDNLEESIS
jgi:glycosyltransferase involved in cell wall biosynthesis